MHDESADDPKPTRRSVHSHVFSGFTLLVSLGVGMWLVDQAGWTNWGEWWRRARIQFVGSDALREQVTEGMLQSTVHHRIGRGQEEIVSEFDMVEDYPQYRSRVVYRFKSYFYGTGWVVDRVEDLP